MRLLEELAAIIRGNPVAFFLIFGLCLGLFAYVFVTTPCGTPVRIFGYEIVLKANCTNSGVITIAAADDSLDVMMNGNKIRTNTGQLETFSIAPYIRPGTNNIVFHLSNGVGTWGLDATVSADNVNPSTCREKGVGREHSLVLTAEISLQANISSAVVAIGQCVYH